MMSSADDKSPEQQVQLEQADSESKEAQGDSVSKEAQSEPVNDEREVEAGKSDPETQRSKPDRYTFITAAISALAALIGALIGSISSYVVAQSNNAAEAEAAQISRKEKTYADFITNQTDLIFADSILSDQIESHPGDTAKRDQDTNTVNDMYGKWLHTNFIVTVVASGTVDDAREKIYQHNLTIRDLTNDLKHEVDSGRPIDETSNKLTDEYFREAVLIEDFAQAAKADVAPEKRKPFLFF